MYVWADARSVWFSNAHSLARCRGAAHKKKECPFDCGHRVAMSALELRQHLVDKHFTNDPHQLKKHVRAVRACVPACVVDACTGMHDNDDDDGDDDEDDDCHYDYHYDL
jgi:hypothetical protein